MTHAAQNWSAALVLLTGCDGCQNDRGNQETVETVAERCDASALAPATPLKRLSAEQYRWTIRDLLASTGETDTEWVAEQFTEVWNRTLPPDAIRGAEHQIRGGYRRLDQDVHQQHVEGYLIIAQSIATEFDLGTAWRAAELMADTCDLEEEVWGSGPGDCVDAWIARMGALTHRRPLTPDQRARYRTIFDGASADAAEGESWERTDLGFRHVVIAMLASPWFSYHVELGDDSGQLDAYEVANRLSYHFWQSSPDPALYAAAADGTLMTDDGYRAQVARMAADPRTRRSLEEFYADWLQVEALPIMNGRLGTPTYDAFAAGFEPSGQLHHAMAEELVALGVHHTLTDPGPLDALYLSDRMVTMDDELATLYGAPAWDGSGTPPALEDARRVGLLTRAGLLATGSANTRPIMKGVFIREGLLCEPLGTPPDNANAVAPELSETQTTRQVVETLTEQPGSACASCHVTLINPLGFATEDFDALGRPRSRQRLFDAAGEEIAAPPVDTRGESRIHGETVTFSDAFDLTSEILASGAAHRCFAREYFRFTHRRAESGPADDCSIDVLGQALLDGQTLDAFLVDVALQPQFRALAPPAL